MRSGYKFALFLSAALGTGATGLASPALAQSSAPASRSTDADLSTVVVTARRIEERLQDVPISITVLNQQNLANANVVNAEDLAKITPSLQVNSNFGSDNTSFAIRGFIQENGTAPSVGVYFADVVAPRGPSNGTPAGDGAGAGSFFDLQNVQVLKGPQGTLQGRNTTGGAVLLVPVKPNGRYEGYIEGTYGNFDERRIQAVVNLPVNDNLRVRLGVDRQMRDGYLNNKSGIGPDHLANVDYTALRGSLVWDVTPNVENYTVASYSNSRNYGDVQKMFAAPGGTFLTVPDSLMTAKTPGYYDVLQAEPHPLSQIRQFQIINTTTWNATDNMTVRNIFSYSELEDRSAQSLFGVVAPFSYAPYQSFASFFGLTSFPTATYPLPFTENRSLPSGYSAHERTFTEEFRLNGNAFDNRLIWQGGLYSEISLPIGVVGAQSGFLSSCTDSGAFQCTDPVGLLAGAHVGTINYTAGQTSFYDYGIYSQATYKFTDQWKLTGGYRYTWDHEADVSTQRTYDLLTPPNYGLAPSTTTSPNPYCTQPLTTPNGCVNHLYSDSSAPTWLIDLDYTPSRDLLVYAKYSRGYREGGIAPNVTAPLNTFKAEKVDSYEGGFKSSFQVPIHGTFDVSGFYNEFTNQQIQLGFNANANSGFASTAAPVNAGASTLWGVEVNATANPFRGMVLSLGYTYLNTRIDKVTNVLNVAITGFTVSAPFKVGDPIVLTPSNKVVLDATYTLPFIDSALGKIAVGATYSHTDRMLGNYADRTVVGLENFSYLPETNLLDLHASWNAIYGSPVDLSFFATNVTGQKYYTYSPGLGTAGFGFDTAELGQPTMYGVRLKYHFGK